MNIGVRGGEEGRIEENGRRGRKRRREEEYSIRYNNSICRII
jgi:hypothetical protein